jgi:hypothetical protein
VLAASAVDSAGASVGASVSTTVVGVGATVVTVGADVSVGLVLSGFFGWTWKPPPQMQQAVFAPYVPAWPWCLLAYASKLCRAVTFPHALP